MEKIFFLGETEMEYQYITLLGGKGKGQDGERREDKKYLFWGIWNFQSSRVKIFKSFSFANVDNYIFLCCNPIDLF